METRSEPVPETAKQAEEVRARWAWAEPSVWTARMLTALETGVKGGKWFSLIDKVHRPQNLRSAFTRVKANGGAAGVDHVSVDDYASHLEANLTHLAQALQGGSYRPQAVRRVWIPKPGSQEQRPLGVPTVRDRVVQGALVNALEPIFERDFAKHSYGFRPGRGCKDALRRVVELLHTERVWVVDADLKSYFDTIPHEQLMRLVEKKVADGRVLTLVELFLGQSILDGMRQWTPDAGTPQGAVLSPLLSNIYLDPLDHKMEKAGYEMVRYADDFVLLCKSESEAQQALAMVREWTEAAGLTLHPEKTRIVDASQPGGFDFLGYHFERGYKWPRKKSLDKFKDAIRAKTSRSNGNSLRVIIADVNRTLRGWFEYFKHSHRTTFRPLDSWTRMRLRSILRKRHGGEGRGRGLDHNRWKNDYFAAAGLFSLVAARRQFVNPLRR